MISLRVAAGATISALALSAATIVSGGATAQAPTSAPSPTASSAPCQGPTAGPGMMDHGSGMSGGMMSANADPAATSSPSQASSTSPTAVRIAVTLADTFRIEPCSMTVRAGEPVTFVVTNIGAIAHEFFLGDEAAQAAHGQEMLSMGGASMHDEPNGIAVAAGETRELTHTFATPGQYLAGCHVPGHYPAGMKAIITVIG